ncbi:MAG: 3-isopropylmalate dehydratase small subunit [Candidatus Bathyarchaeum sp.]|jgi:3-isopropylmalate/(R)-2-methylmalate dehydratase small subunit|nr:3-isopropylmalate dehydratase small subunit [Candidatus Bathyarchaeota archaeon]TET27706.1 MAG: 3-isopropylmalate dehydratase small subunit [Candidatus Bathyarchaeum sp.]
MRAWKFGDDINTDVITPGRYTVTTDRKRLGEIAFIEYRPEFAKEVEEGDVIVAGSNFGCGSSREHSPVAIKAAGVSAVIAKTFARIFFRNSINIGLPLFVCEDADKIDDGDDIEINIKTGEVRDKTKDIVLKAKPLPEFMQRIVEKGGLVNFLRSDGYDNV